MLYRFYLSVCHVKSLLRVALVTLYSCSARKSMETRSQQDEERANILEVQVDESRVVAEDADRKYEEVRWRVSACACPSCTPLVFSVTFLSCRHVVVVLCVCVCLRVMTDCARVRPIQPPVLHVQRTQSAGESMRCRRRPMRRVGSQAPRSSVSTARNRSEIRGGVSYMSVTNVGGGTFPKLGYVGRSQSLS